MIDFDPAVEPRAFLRQIYAIEHEIDQLQRMRKSLRNSLISPGGMGEGVSGTRDPDRYGNVFAKLENIERRMDERIDRLVNMKDQAEELIECIKDSRQRMVLRERYLQKHRPNWEYIAQKMYCDRRTVLRLHGSALDSFRRAASEKKPEVGL